MARQPRFGMGKRRLAAQCGELAAWQFQRRNLEQLVRRLESDPRWTLELALTPSADYAPLPRIPAISRHPQQSGDLGQRILGELFPRAPSRHSHACRVPRLVIGADIAGVRPAHIRQALKALGQHDWVLGPAEDGGFWLIGTAGGGSGKRPDFTGVPWGTGEAFSAASQRLPGRCAQVERLFDVDDACDLERWRRGR